LHNTDTFLSFFSSFVSTRVGGGVSFGFYTAIKVKVEAKATN